MKNNVFHYLQVGDVIKLSKGMEVYGEIPSKFVFGNGKFSLKKTNSEITIGKTYHNDTEVEYDVKKTIKKVIEAFDYVGFQLKEEDANNFVLDKLKKPKKESFILKGGEFVVVKTNVEGGGSGMGFNDTYPDGYKVYCKRLCDGEFDEKGTEVSFYQIGCFSAMIKNIEVVKKIKLKFV